MDAGETGIPLAFTIFQGINIIGVKICGRLEYDEMFAFCARHGIKPTIQEYPMTPSGIENALESLRQGKAHYRAVLVVE